MKLSYKYRLFFVILCIFAAFAACLVLVQQGEERKLKTEMLEKQLADYIIIIEKYILAENLSDTSIVQLRSLEKLLPDSLRLTVIDGEGKVLYDRDFTDVSKLENHLNRPEFLKAKHNNYGADIRHSASTNRDYLYYAAFSSPYYVRVALPYNVQTKSLIEADNLFIYTVLSLFMLLLFVVNIIAGRFGKSISQLKNFASQLKDGLSTGEIAFPSDELGEIGQDLVEIFRQKETARHATETEKEKNRLLKQEMTSNIAHELRTPVTSIRGYLETLCEQNLPAEKREQFTQRAFIQAIRLSALIDDVALLSKIEDSPNRFIMEPINISQVINDVSLDLADKLKSKGISLQINVNERLIAIGNYSLLYSVFRNLMDNTIAYSGENIEIQIENFKQDDVFIYFSYADNGVGVSEQHLDRLFERFYRIQEGRSRESGGSGLGLSIVKNAICLHGGEIEAHTRTGGGLEFLFSIRKQER
ncbi:MAG: HAMP domain-containing histidine kinase [Prevotella sp.]|jgi:signal transduction histidine kinase|nr:HAMP domain-containing histidine kinase [Prevotella sp.]